MTTDIISSIAVSVLEVPFDKPIRSALGTYVGSDYVVVELQTASGVRGYGYTMSLDRRGTKAVVSYIENELTPLALDQHVSAPATLWNRMWSPNKARMRGGVGVHALSAVDTAVWDVTAKLKELPLATLLGGTRETIEAYGSGGWLSLSDDELIEEAQSHAENGITGYKIKIGGPRDPERIELLRKEMGDDFILYTDANQNYSVEEAPGWRNRSWRIAPGTCRRWRKKAKSPSPPVRTSTSPGAFKTWWTARPVLSCSRMWGAAAG